MTLPKHFWFLLISTTLSPFVFAQQFIGVGTGNYGGVTSLSLNPSSIADSRHKFDINLFSISSYFDNNLVDVKRDAIYRGLFFKSPYNSNYNAVRRDLLSLQELPANERVNALTETRIMAPLSAMITTSKKSAIGITFQSRAGVQTYNMARNTAQMLYEELNVPALYGMAENNNGVENNYLRWQEVGFTYARVLVNSGVHFLKAGVTGKWLMGQAGAYIQSDNLNVTFNSQTELTLQSPLIKYYRSEQADINQFNTNSFFKDIEDHGFGWDAGITYEFRGNINKFRFEGVDNEMIERRDMNKYSIRVAAAIMDAGKLQFAKLPLTNDHSANFMNWNFAGVKANNFSEFDTAYATQVQYAGGADENFVVAMPTALSANIDFRIHNGFYINAAMYKPLNSFNSNTQSGLRPVEWFAITPRFETRAFGVYVPVTMTNLHNRADVGLTLRLGPLFIGSNNLASYVFNDKVPTADVHAGIKIGITYGTPSKLMKSLEKLRLSAIQKDSLILKDSLLNAQTANKLEAKYIRTIDSLKAITDSITLRNTIMAELAKADSLKKTIQVEKSAPAVNIIINNYLPSPQDTLRKLQSTKDTIVINNRLPVAVTNASLSAATNSQIDSILRQKDSEVEFLLRQNAEQSKLLSDLGTLRMEDSVKLYQLQEDRKRLESILSDNLEKERLQSVPVQQVLPAPEKQERRSIFKRNRDRANATQPQQQTYLAFTVPQDVLFNRNLNTQHSKADVRALQNSNRALELEMQSLGQSMTQNTEMMTKAMAMNSAAQVRAARPLSNEAGDADDPLVPELYLLSRLAFNNADSLTRMVGGANNIASITQKVDTVFIRDTVFLQGAPMVTRPIQALDPVIIRDTTIIEKSVSIYTPPEAVSVFFSSGSTTLSLNAKKLLEKWSHEASTFHTAYEVHLVGKTDATGLPAINKRVAQNRINTVGNFLTAHGVNQQNIRSSIALAPAGTSGSNPLNRRVDVKMVTIVP